MTEYPFSSRGEGVPDNVCRARDMCELFGSDGCTVLPLVRFAEIEGEGGGFGREVKDAVLCTAFGCILRGMDCLSTPSLDADVPSMRSVAVADIFSLPLEDMLERIWVIRDKIKAVGK